MPRNIEYLLERYIEEEKLPQFILTRAIDCGFFPSSKILEKFGNGYGPDNFILSHDDLLQQKLSTENELELLLRTIDVNEKELQNEIDKKYTNEYIEYQRYLAFYRNEIIKLNKMIKYVDELTIDNEKEEKFLNYINEYFVHRKNEIDERFKKHLIKPVKETMEQVKQRLKDKKTQDLKEIIDNIELRLLFDDNFFEEITRKWFNK